MYSMLLPLDLLHSFLTVITVGSMSRACRSLGRTQAAVSLQIQRLEDLSGGKLIERRTRPLQTTPRGELVLQHARDMLEMNAAFVARLKDDEVSGSLRVGIPNDFATRFLPRVLAAFVRSHPGISLEVESDISDRLSARFSDGELDLVLAIRGQHGWDRPSRVWHDPLVWIGQRAAIAKKARSHRPQSPLSLVTYPEGCGYRRRMLTALERNEIAHRIAYTSLDLSGLSVAVENGLGITALAKHTLPTPLKSLILTDSPLPPLEQVEIGLLCKEESLSPRALNTLRDSFIEAMDSRLFQT
ncbi:LysR family transcriptional regulator [Limibacillus sp. MBR-115]|uniref:LysR family transcriptional regulator n=1 Tax=Limibacillus sp. MBR-115 TaxID=3156465 RepID=UPI0033933A20